MMLDLSDPGTSSRSVVTLRLSGRSGLDLQYGAALAQHGLKLIECSTPDAAEDMLHGGCRVGLLIITKEVELSVLDRWEALVSDSSVCWVALVDRELAAKPRMREFIGEHLFNFIMLPAKLEHIALTLRHAWGMAFMRDGQRAPLRQPDNAEAALVGDTPQMRHVARQIRKIARVDAPVLICGPSGSGKELAARAIHRQSARKPSPFVVLSCGAITPQAFDSGLFGCADADDREQPHANRIEAAKGGTLFLSAIDDLSSGMQASLLRFLDGPGRERLETEAVAPANVRVMAATHADLAEAVRQGRFRDDLYYRLNVVRLSMPPLAERGPDIEAIARHTFARFAKLHNRSLRGFSKAAMHALLSYAWPGNVTELIGRVQAATAMAEGRFIQPEDLGLERGRQPAELMSLEDARAAAERAMIQRSLAHSRNQISRAAAVLGISRVTLYRLIEKYNIRPESASATPAPFASASQPEAEARN